MEELETLDRSETERVYQESSLVFYMATDGVILHRLPSKNRLLAGTLNC